MLGCLFLGGIAVRSRFATRMIGMFDSSCIMRSTVLASDVMSKSGGGLVSSSRQDLNCCRI
jgi:hypothetical protein